MFPARLFLDLPHDDATQDLVLLLDELGLDRGDIAELHRGQRPGDLVILLEQLVVDQLQLVETLPVIAQLALRIGKFLAHAVQAGLEAGDHLFLFLGIARHALDLHGGLGQLALKLAIGFDQVRRLFQGGLGFSRFFPGLVTGRDELHALLLEFGHTNGERLRFGFGCLGILDRLVARGGQGVTLDLQFLAARLGLLGPRGQFLDLLGAFGDAAAEFVFLAVGRRDRGLQIPDRGTELVDFFLG